MLNQSTAFSSFSTDKLLDSYLFYNDLLGLDVDLVNDQFVHLDLPGGNLLAIYYKQDHIPSNYTVLNFQVENIDQAVDHLTEEGVRFLQYGPPLNTNPKGITSDENGTRIAWFEDPGKNIIALVEE